MPLLINVNAVEETSLPSRLQGSLVTDAQMETAFRSAERGLFRTADGRTRSRTPLNGGWVGAMAVTRSPDGNVDSVMRTWALNDAQVAASGLTSIEAINAFVAALTDDTANALDTFATRVRYDPPVRGTWSATSTTRTGSPSAPPIIAPSSQSSSNIGWWLLIAAAVGTGVLIYNEAD